MSLWTGRRLFRQPCRVCFRQESGNWSFQFRKKRNRKKIFSPKRSSEQVECCFWQPEPTYSERVQKNSAQRPKTKNKQWILQKFLLKTFHLTRKTRKKQFWQPCQKFVALSPVDVGKSPKLWNFFWKTLPEMFPWTRRNELWKPCWWFLGTYSEKLSQNVKLGWKCRFFIQ